MDEIIWLKMDWNMSFQVSVQYSSFWGMRFTKNGIWLCPGDQQVLHEIETPNLKMLQGQSKVILLPKLTQNTTKKKSLILMDRQTSRNILIN